MLNNEPEIKASTYDPVKPPSYNPREVARLISQIVKQKEEIKTDYRRFALSFAGAAVMAVCAHLNIPKTVGWVYAFSATLYGGSSIGYYWTTRKELAKLEDTVNSLNKELNNETT